MLNVSMLPVYHISQGNCCNGFCNHGHPQSDTQIMTTFNSEVFYRLCGVIPGLLLLRCAAGRFYRNSENQFITIGYTAVDATGIVGFGRAFFVYDGIIVQAALHACRGKAAPKLYTLDSGYSKNSMCNN